MVWLCRLRKPETTCHRNIDGFSVGRRIGGDLGNAAILDDYRLIPHGNLLVPQRPTDPFGLDDRTRHALALC